MSSRAPAWLAMAVLLAGCSPNPDTTPLPTKDKTIDRVTQKLEAAREQGEQRREEMERAAK